MIKNDSLANRLNSYRKGDKSPTPTPKHSNYISPIFNLLHVLLDLGISVALAIIYGYAIKVIFATDWKILAILAVGYVVQNLLFKILKLFSKD